MDILEKCSDLESQTKITQTQRNLLFLGFIIIRQLNF